MSESLRKEAEDELKPVVSRLLGRTIVAVEFHAEDAPPGFPEGADVEGATITLDDGTKLSLSAVGWHDIQSLIVELDPPPPDPPTEDA